MKKKIISYVVSFGLVLAIFFGMVFNTALVAYADATIDAIGAIRDFGKDMLEMAGTVATSKAAIEASNAERRYYDTLTAQANGSYAAKSWANGSGSARSIMNTTNNTITYLNTTNNTSVTNNYKSSYYNSTYNTYIFEGDEYNYYVTYQPQYTYITYVGTTAEWDSRQEIYYYYELPDGRNSYDLTEDEIYGMVMNYDVSNYYEVAESAGMLGLYHFDGDSSDASTGKNNLTWNSGSSITYLDNGSFSGALYLDNTEHSFTLPSDVGSDFTIEFRLYTAINQNALGYTKTLKAPVAATYNYEHYHSPVVDQTCSNCGYTTYKNAEFGYINVFVSYNKGHVTYSDVGHSTSCGTYIASAVCARCKKASYITWKCSSVSKITKTPASSGYTRIYPNAYTSYMLNGSNKLEQGSYWSYAYNYAFTDEVYNAYSFDGFTIKVGETDLLRLVGKSTLSNGISSSNPSLVAFLNGVDGPVSVGSGSWQAITLSSSGGNVSLYINGVCVASASSNGSTGAVSFNWSDDLLQYSYLDELRVLNFANYIGSTYSVSSAPFDTDSVLVLPDVSEYGSKAIVVQTNTAVSGSRIGGVRPTFPSEGFFYANLDSNYKVVSTQQYINSTWTTVKAAVRSGDSWVSMTDYKFMASDSSLVVNPDSGSSGSGSEASGGDSSSGSDSGSGSGSGSSSGGSSSGSDTQTSEKTSGLISSIFKFVSGLFVGILDGILNLFTTVSESLSTLATVGGGFVGLLGILMPFIPSEMLSVLTLGVSVSVLLMILKLVKK